MKKLFYAFLVLSLGMFIPRAMSNNSYIPAGDVSDLLTVSGTVTNVSCYNTSTGSIDITVNGGTATYTISWSNGASTEDLTNIIAGTYTVTVTDFIGDVATASWTVSQPNPIVITPTITNVDCFGNATGAIGVTLTGGTPQFTVFWSNSFTTTSISNLIAGGYTITATDSKSCTEVSTFTVTQPDALTLSGTATDPSCYQFNDGAISLESSGGTLNYGWLWNDGNTSSSRTNLLAGTYSVTLTDNHNCTESASFTLTDPMPVTGTLSQVNQTLTCSGNTITPISFSADFYTSLQTTTTWTRNQPSVIGSIPLSGSGNITGTLFNHTEFNVTVTFTITPTANGCEGPAVTSTVVVPPSIQDSVVITSPIQCYGGTANVIVYPYWGNAPYSGGGSYTWGVGDHIITITDNTGCSINDTIYIAEPALLAATFIKQDLLCNYDNNGSINLNTVGGTQPYSWLWNDDVTEEDRIDLAPGTYSVTITDANNCTANYSIAIDYTYDAPDAVFTADPQACYGNAHQLNITFTGTPPFSFTYTDGSQLQTVSNIPTHTYSFWKNVYNNTVFAILSIQDAHCSGALVTAQPVIVVVIPLPSAQMLTPAPICTGETATIPIVLSGTPPWDITYSDGTSHTINNIQSSPYNLQLTPASTQNYQLTVVRDANCYAQNMGTAVTALVRLRPTAAISGGPISICAGLQANIPLSLSGQSPWTVTYSDGTNTYTLSGINSPTSSIPVNPNSTSTYTLLSVQDAFCSGTVTGAAVEIIVKPRPVADWSGSVDTICEGTTGTFSINLTGTPPFNLSWFDNSPHSAVNIMTSPFTFTASPAFSATFVVTALSDLNCVASMTGQSLNVFVDKTPTALLADHSPMCQETGGDLKINLTGVAPWKLTWKEDTITHIDSNILVNPYYIHVEPSDTTVYQLVAIQDAYCTGYVSSFPITVIVYPSPVATVSGITPFMEVCQGNGIEITADFISGTPGYTMLFKDADLNYVVFSDLHQGDIVTLYPPASPGIYPYQLVSITDSNGCFVPFNTDFTVKVNTKPVVTAGPDSSINLGNSVMLQGAYTSTTLPASILWSPSTLLDDPTALNPLATPISTTNYGLYVTDSNGCVGEDHVLITILIEQAVFGYVKYDNSAKTPLSGVKVVLFDDQGSRMDSTITNGSGYYQLTDITNGDYTLQLESNKPWILQNATDALLILKHFVQLSQLSGIRLQAANVDATNLANATDALLVAKRFTGQLTSFPLGNWVFETVNFTIPDTAYQHDIKGLCAGDVNGSSIPGAKMSRSLDLMQSGELTVTNGQLFSFPLSVDRPVTIAASSIVLSFPANRIQIEDVKMEADANPIYFVNGNELRVAWYSLMPKALAEGETLFTVTARMTSSETNPLYFELTDASQVADADGQSPDYMNLVMPKIIAAPSMTNLLSAPNPASENTRCIFTLAEDATVRISLIDPLGKEISLLTESAHTSGTHSLDIDLKAYATGMYFLRMETRTYNGITNTRVEKLSIIK